jgi:hypothetical protein
MLLSKIAGFRVLLAKFRLPICESGMAMSENQGFRSWHIRYSRYVINVNVVYGQEFSPFLVSLSPPLHLEPG